MDKITKERIKIWERRLEGGLDGGDVRDVLNDWKQDVGRYEDKIEGLTERSEFLFALEEAGVDNWEGYSHAHEILEERNA
jgi:hypothetical protein